jgi:hypothetical protein
MPRLVRDSETTIAPSSTPASITTNNNDSTQARVPEPTKTSAQATNPRPIITEKKKEKKAVDAASVAVVTIPPPPPNVPEIQLRVWNVTLSRRMRQLKQLSPEYLNGLGYEITEDFMKSRYGTNDYSNALKLLARRDRYRENSSSSNEGGLNDDDDDTDLASGRYSSLFLQQNQNESIVNNFSPESIGRHFLALFYRSIDNRLPPAMSKHGLDSLRKACASLDRWMRKWDEEEKDSSRKRKRPEEEVEEEGGGDKDDTGNTADDRVREDEEDDGNNHEDEEEMRSNHEEEPPPPALKAPNVDVVKAAYETAKSAKEAAALAEANRAKTTANLTISSIVSDRARDNAVTTTSAEQQQPDTAGNSANVQTMNYTSVQGASTATGQQEQVPASTLINNTNEKKSPEEQINQKDPPKVTTASESAPPKVTTATPNPQIGGGGAVADQDAVGSGDKRTNAVICQGGAGEETANIGQSELRVTTSTDGTVPVDDPPLHSRSGVDTTTTDTAKDSPSNTPAGYRRRSIRNCTVDDCPNKGGKCNLHGKLGKTCKVEGCDKFQVQGFDVCIKHGARNPHVCKADGCKKQIVKGGFCTSHHREFINSTQTSSGDQMPGASEYATASVVSSVRNPLPTAAVAKPPEPQHDKQLNNDLPRSQLEFKEDNNNGLQSSTEGSGGDKQQNSDAGEVIDLTANSPVQARFRQETNAAELEEEAAKKRAAELAELLRIEDGSKKKAEEEEEEARKKAPSPPPSPPPSTILRTPPPSAKPRPEPFSNMNRIVFSADPATDRGTTISGCINQWARPNVLVDLDLGYHLDGVGGALCDAECISVSERLSTWDPYWKIIDELGHYDVSCGNGMTSIGSKTTPCVPIDGATTAPSVRSASIVSIDFQKEISRSTHADTDERGRKVDGFRPWGVKWGKISRPENNSLKGSYKQGDRRVIMRCLPLCRTAKEKKNKADGHVWPRGSFVQIKRGKNQQIIVIPVTQRKQQSHDHSKWIGNSIALDLTRYIIDTRSPLDIKICCAEVIAANERGGLENNYAVHVAVCEYTEPDVLCDQLIGKTEGQVIMPMLSLRSAKRKLKEYIADNTIAIDSDDECDNADSKKESESDFLTFSLLDTISNRLIEIPVRGQQCTHLQCFDLRNYLTTNTIVSGSRWRCPCCELFVSVRDLVHCGLFQAMLDDVGDQIVAGVRDSALVKSDGTWQLVENKKSNNGGASSAMDIDNLESVGEELLLPGPDEPEVIEIL